MVPKLGTEPSARRVLLTEEVLRANGFEAAAKVDQALCSRMLCARYRLSGLIEFR